MKRSNRTIRIFVLGFCGLIWGTMNCVGVSSQAWAQGNDQEPNDTCQTAQNMGAITLPFEVAGGLDSTPKRLDVDFFKFKAGPGTLVRIDLQGQGAGQGTLEDPLLGFFDSSCNFISSNDNEGTTLDSKLVLTVPVDGILILAATAFPDFGFSGGGVGTYQLTMAIPPTIGSISGRVIDAVTKQPLPGGVAPFASVQLLHCETAGCFTVNSQQASSRGEFLFNSDSLGQPLEVGTYEIGVFADEYQLGQSAPFAVGEGQEVDIGDLALQPFPVRFSDIVPCADIPADGGRCRFSVTVTNRLATRLSGEAWVLVQGFGIGSFVDFTNFQVNHTPNFALRSQDSRIAQFDFKVPAKVRDNAFLCTTIFVGQRPEPMLDVVGTAPLFCVIKEGGTFRLMPPREAHERLRQLNGRNLTPLR